MVPGFISTSHDVEFHRVDSQATNNFNRLCPKGGGIKQKHHTCLRKAKIERSDRDLPSWIIKKKKKKDVGLRGFQYRWSLTYNGLTYAFSTLRWCGSHMHNTFQEMFSTILSNRICLCEMILPNCRLM